MDFELTNVQKDVQRAAREFAESEFLSAAREYDRKEEYPVQL